MIYVIIYFGVGLFFMNRIIKETHAAFGSRYSNGKIEYIQGDKPKKNLNYWVAMLVVSWFWPLILVRVIVDNFKR